MKPFVAGDRVALPGGRCGILMGVVQGIAHVRLEDGDPQEAIQRTAFKNLKVPSSPPPAAAPKVTVVVDGTKETEPKVGAVEVQEELVIEQKPAEEEAPDSMAFLKDEPELYSEEDGSPNIATPSEVVYEGAQTGRLSSEKPNPGNTPKTKPTAPRKITKKWLEETPVEELQQLVQLGGLSKTRAKKVQAAIDQRTKA